MKLKIFIVLVFLLTLFFSCSSTSTKVVVNEDIFDFGMVYVNDSTSHDFILENKTNKIVGILNTRIQGSNEFIVVSGGTGSFIQPKEILKVSVSFQPVNKGYEQASLFILHSESLEEFEITLEATGETKPAFDIDITSYDYGRLSKGLDKSQNFTISNIGTDVLTLNSIGISGPNSSDFTIIAGGNSPVNVDPGNTHTVSVRWESKDPIGMKNAFLDITHNAQGALKSITLVAETTAIPPLVLVTTTLKDAENWKPYDDQLVTSGGTGNVTFAVISGYLPGGISLDSQTGKFSGTPHKVEKCDFEVEIDDGVTNITRMLSIEVMNSSGWVDVTPNGVTLSGKECIASYKSKLYYFSGSNYSYDIRIFDPVARTWHTSKTKLQYDHENGNACVYDNYIYVLMGSKMDQVERYDPAADTVATDTPAPLQWVDFAVGVYNKEIYCISGYDGGSSPFDEVYKFTPGPNGTNGTWTQMPNAKTSGFGAGLTVYNNQIVLFGGWDTNNNGNVRTYDPATGNEVILGKLYAVSSRFAWGRIGDEIYLGVGGSKTFQKYNLLTDVGTKLADSPVSTTYYASQYTECDGRIYVSDKKTKIYAYIP